MRWKEGEEEEGRRGGEWKEESRRRCTNSYDIELTKKIWKLLRKIVDKSEDMWYNM